VRKARTTIYDMPFKKLILVLDKEFSYFVRLSAAASDTGLASCVTCGKIDHWKNQTLGHYITRARIAVRWDERNTACQCRYCNTYQGGLPHLMRKHLVQKFGEEEILKMEEYSRFTGVENSESLIFKIISLRGKNRLLAAQKNLKI
jgi:hypothetical protein